jgi:hypothetical protein
MTNDSKNALSISGADLLADLDSQPGLGVTTEYAFWMGVVPSCPVAQINAGGLNFPKMNERLIDSPNRTGEKLRVPEIGGLNKHVNIQHIERLKELIPRLVLRFKDDPVEAEEPGSGENIGHVHQRPRRGYVVTIPTEEEIAKAKEAGANLPRYVRQPLDEPAAKYMFLKLCADQEMPQREAIYPPTLDVTGIEWPDEESMRSAAELLA